MGKSESDSEVENPVEGLTIHLGLVRGGLRPVTHLLVTLRYGGEIISKDSVSLNDLRRSLGLGS